MENKNNYKVYEKIVNDLFRDYEKTFNSINEGWEMVLSITMEIKEIEIKQVKKDTAYFRVERVIQKIDNPDEGEVLLIYNQFYPFKDKGEQTDKNKWMIFFYKDLLIGLMGSGLEYLDALEEIRKVNKRTDEQKEKFLVESEDPELQITSKMPEPLNDSEKEYKKWVDANNENVQS